MSELPVTIEQITAEWVGAALGARYPGIGVQGISVGEALQGTASKIRLEVRYDAAGVRAGLPETLIVKGGFGPHRELMYREYRLEARFYAELAPRLPSVRVPRSYFAAWDDQRRQGIVILEDLEARGVRFCRVQRSLDFEEAAAQLAMLASCHAQWWSGKAPVPGGEFGWIETLDPLPEGEAGAYQRGQLRPEIFAHYTALPRGLAISRHFHDRDRMERAMERLRVLDRAGPFCLLHTDPHLGNLYFDADGAPGLLDWQSVRWGPWSHDFNYFLVSSLDMLDRREWERPLLQHYLDALRGHGVKPPDFDDAWLAYRSQSVYGLYYWLVNPVEFQVEVNNCAVTPRFAFAAIDHGTLEMLEA